MHALDEDVGVISILNEAFEVDVVDDKLDHLAVLNDLLCTDFVVNVFNLSNIFCIMVSIENVSMYTYMPSRMSRNAFPVSVSTEPLTYANMSEMLRFVCTP